MSKYKYKDKKPTQHSRVYYLLILRQFSRHYLTHTIATYHLLKHRGILLNCESFTQVESTKSISGSVCIIIQKNFCAFINLGLLSFYFAYTHEQEMMDNSQSNI